MAYYNESVIDAYMVLVPLSQVEDIGEASRDDVRETEVNHSERKRPSVAANNRNYYKGALKNNPRW